MSLKEKIWTSTPDGGHWFRCGVEYSYELPGDVDNVLMYEVDIRSLYSPEPTYMIDVHNNKLRVYFAGLGLTDEFAASIKMAYSSKVKSKEFHRMPFSSMKKDEDYMQEARLKVIRGFPAWPYCNKHQKAHEIELKTKSEGNNLVIAAFLKCPTC